jgi:dihydrofolate reductase
MRKMYLFMMVSLDGFFEGQNHDLSWHNVDSEFNEFAVKQLGQTSTLVFGGKTYGMMADFWPKDNAKKAAPETAERMNNLQKIVFSKNIKSASWNNSELYGYNVAGTVRTLKRKDGKEIAVLGSSNLCLTLLKERLIDELRIMVNPIVLGKGNLMFSGIGNQLELELANSRPFHSGNILLTYNIKD